MSSPTVLLKVATSAGGTWTFALRVATTAPMLSVENPKAVLIQVEAKTSGPVLSAVVTVPASGQQQPQPLLIQPVTTQSESYSVVPSTVGSSSFIQVSTSIVTFSSLISI